MRSRPLPPTPAAARPASAARARATRLAAGLALVLAASCGGAGDAPGRRPDVVLVLVDTLRADRLGCYGYPRPTSPTIDALASEGALFEDVTCQFSWTRPSMVSIFHGRYLTAYRDALDPTLPALAEVFRDAGYRTVGAVANRLVNDEGAFERGFERFDWATPSRRRGTPEEPVARDLDELCRDLWPLVDAALDEAGARVDAGSPRAPLFVYVHALDPHDPYEPHPELDLELDPAGAEPVLPADFQAEALRARGRPVDERALAELALERGRYDQGVRHLDRQLEDLLDGLRTRRLLEHAVVALASDHGEGLWEHVTPAPDDELATLEPVEFFYQRHGASQYQEVLATPLVLWGHGVPAGRRVAEAVQNIDLFPTLLELTDVPAPGDLHGRSLVPAMRGRAPARGQPGGEPEFVFAYGVHGNTVRETAGDLKLVVPRGKALLAGHGMRLYDLVSDPHERRDLSAERPADVDRLARAWKRWQEEHPTNDNRGAAMQRKADREHQKILQSLGYTDLDTGLDADANAAPGVEAGAGSDG